MDDQNADGETPLHWAVINNQKEIIAVLLENNVNF